MKMRSSGKIINVEEIFPEWDICDENWNDFNYDSCLEPYYPEYIRAIKYKKIAEIFDIPKSDGYEGKGKKGKTESKLDFDDEKDQVESGKLLPRIFINEEKLRGHDIQYPFLSLQTNTAQAQVSLF